MEILLNLIFAILGGLFGATVFENMLRKNFYEVFKLIAMFIILVLQILILKKVNKLL